jgi:hypothetical protein
LFAIGPLQPLVNPGGGFAKLQPDQFPQDSPFALSQADLLASLYSLLSSLLPSLLYPIFRYRSHGFVTPVAQCLGYGLLKLLRAEAVGFGDLGEVAQQGSDEVEAAAVLLQVAQ